MLTRAHLALVIISCLSVQFANSVDMHANPRELLEFWHLHEHLIESLEDVMEVPESYRLSFEKYRKEFRIFHQYEVDLIIGHPVNLVILYNLWQESTDLWLTYEQFCSVSCKNLTHFVRNLPSNEDLSGVIANLLRLQSLYELKTSDLASGLVQNRHSVRPLNKNECFLVVQIAVQLVMRDEYSEWFHVCNNMSHYEIENDLRLESYEENLSKMDSVIEELKKASNNTDNTNTTLDNLRKNLPMDLIHKLYRDKNHSLDDPGDLLFDAYRYAGFLKYHKSY